MKAVSFFLKKHNFFFICIYVCTQRDFLLRIFGALTADPLFLILFLPLLRSKQPFDEKGYFVICPSETNENTEMVVCKWHFGYIRHGWISVKDIFNKISVRSEVKDLKSYFQDSPRKIYLNTCSLQKLDKS